VPPSLERLKNSVLDVYKRTPFVVRTFLTTKDKYVESIEEADYEGNSYTQAEKDEIVVDLPDLFWVTEFSHPDIFTTKKRKIADVIYKSDIDPALKFDLNDAFNHWVQVRFPRYLIRKSKENTPYFVYNLNVVSYLPIIRQYNSDELLEW
jgi:hypothetical protein